ncbi:MAG: DUF2589 domain-containing protein [Oscillospiraceae bacterium]|nr:DUF2589 domain-containing protein [Oscillospiraceae bacterium]
MYNPADEVSSINFGSIIGGALNAVVNAQKESAQTTVNFVKNVGFKPGHIDKTTGREVGVGDPVCVAFSYDKEVSPARTASETQFFVTVVNGGEGYLNADNLTLSIGDKSYKAEFTLSSGKISGVTLLDNLPGDTAANSGVKVEDSSENGGSGAELKLKVVNAGETVPALFQKMKIEVPILTMMPIPFIRIDNTDIEFNVKINSVSNSESKDVSNSDVKSSSTFGYKGWGFKADTTLNASISNQKSTTNSENVKKDYSLNIKVHAVQDDIPAGMSRILDILEENISTKPIGQPVQKPAEETPKAQ